MKEIEQRTEAIARELCQERGLPIAMMELMLAEAYDLVYFGNKTRLKQIEAKIAKRYATAHKSAAIRDSVSKRKPRARKRK